MLKHKTTQTRTNHLASIISGARFDKDLTCRQDSSIVARCIEAGLFHKGRKNKSSLSLSQFIYNAMVEHLEDDVVITKDKTQPTQPINPGHYFSGNPKIPGWENFGFSPGGTEITKEESELQSIQVKKWLAEKIKAQKDSEKAERIRLQGRI